MFHPFVVLFDSSVLYPAPIRDIVIELGCAGFYQAKWTEEIHKEWIRSLIANRADLNEEKLRRTKELMNQSIPDCLVEGYEQIVETLNLPDPDDNHVLAAAIKCHAQLIVTSNLKDFPNKLLQRYSMEAIHPDEFFLDQFDLNKPLFLHCIKQIRKRLKNPQKSAEEYLFILQQVKLFKTVDELEKFVELI